MLNIRNQQSKLAFLKGENYHARNERDAPSNTGHSQAKISKFSRSLHAQMKLAGACYILAVSCGMSIGHPSALLPELLSNHSSIPTDKETGAWIARTHSIAMPVGCLLGGILMEYLGRRKAIILNSGLFAIGWLLITAAQNHAMIFAGRAVNGNCEGFSVTVIVVMIMEFSEPITRGPLTVIMGLSIALGSGLIYGLGLFLEWYVVSGVASLLPLLSMVAFFFLPESAVWLTRKYRMIEARHTLYWVYGHKYWDQAESEHEDMLRRRRADEEETFRKCAGFSTSFFAVITKKWKILTTPYVLKPVSICLVYTVLQVFCSIHFFVKHFVEVLVSRKGTNSYEIAVLTELLRIPGLIVATIQIYLLGRRSLSISSGLSSSVFTFALGAVLYIQTYYSKPLSSETERWVSILLVLLYITANTWGFFVLSFMIVELLPGKVRGILFGLVYAVNNILTYILVTVYPKLSDVIGSHGMYWTISLLSLICTLFIYLFLPETRGKTLTKLEDYFRQNNLFSTATKLRHSHQGQTDINLNEVT